MYEPKPFKIWFEQFDENGNKIGEGVYHKEYISDDRAHKTAEKVYGDRKGIKYKVARLNPFVEHTERKVCSVCAKAHDVEVEPVIEHVISNTISLSCRNPRRSYECYRHVCPECMNKIIKSIEKLKEKK